MPRLCTCREAAVAHDVLQQIAWAGGPSTVQPPLNYPRSSYESLPLFRYLRDTCSLADACRLLREGLLEDLLGAGKQVSRRRHARRLARSPAGRALPLHAERAPCPAPCPAQRLRRHATLVPQPPRGADIPVGPAAALGGSRPLAAARCKRQVDGAGAPGAKRSKTSHAACDQPPKLRSTWAEIPAGSGAYLVNLTERTLRMREISVPGENPASTPACRLPADLPADLLAARAACLPAWLSPAAPLPSAPVPTLHRRLHAPQQALQKGLPRRLRDPGER